MRLYTFLISHYSEKARWALDHKGLTYESIHLVPGLHVVTTMRVAGRRQVPILVDGAKTVSDSTEILDYLDETYPERPLTPPDAADGEQARSIASFADREIGGPLRRVLYDALLDGPEVPALWAQGASTAARVASRLTYPLMKAAVRRTYRIHRSEVDASRARLLAALRELDPQLEGRRYFVAERFTRADLTLAALLSPLTMPEEHPCRWPKRTPQAVEDLRRDIGDSLAVRHAQAMYREHRRPSGTA